MYNISVHFSSVQSLSRVWLFATPWIPARQASLSITNSRSSLRLTSIESVMPCSHLILCRPLLLLPQIPPASESFPMSQLFTWGGQSTGVSALASFLLKKSQGWSPSEWTGWISLQYKGFPRVFSNTTVQKHCPITPWQTDGETMETVTDFIFLGSKIIADGDCSHEIKRLLLLRRKVLTNLDSILKSWDITLPTKVYLVKAIFFPVVMNGCESQTIKEAEHWRINAFELWCWESLGLQGDQSSPS